ncbi:hypothetical protein FRC09_014319 [Ceratobasidium sp. 395]|nr:hypothetical protein FRC09_014319 [Ceratobasidium sp. 395]
MPTPAPIRPSRSAFVDHAAPHDLKLFIEYSIRAGVPSYRPPLPSLNVVHERPRLTALPSLPVPTERVYPGHPAAPRSSGIYGTNFHISPSPKRATQSAYIRPLPVPTTQPRGPYIDALSTTAPATASKPAFPKRISAYPPPPVPPFAPVTAPPIAYPMRHAVGAVPDPILEFHASIEELHSTLEGVTKLTEENYAQSSAQVFEALEVRDMEYFVDGTLQWPDPRNMVDYEACRKCDRLVSEVIERTLDESQLGCVMGQASAADQWRVLWDAHAIVSEARVMQLWMKLDNTRLAEGESMTTHLNNLRDIIRQLRELGHTIPEETQRLVYL